MNPSLKRDNENTKLIILALNPSRRDNGNKKVVIFMSALSWISGERNIACPFCYTSICYEEFHRDAEFKRRFRSIEFFTMQCPECKKNIEIKLA